MPQPETGQQLAPAILEESFNVDQINVIGQEAEGGRAAHIILRFLAGPTPAGTYLVAKAGRLQPDLAVQLGEHLAREGRRLKTGLTLAGPAVPRDILKTG